MVFGVPVVGGISVEIEVLIIHYYTDLWAKILEKRNPFLFLKFILLF